MGWLVVVARGLVSRKTPIYFMIIIRDKMVIMVEMVIMVDMVIMVEMVIMVVMVIMVAIVIMVTKVISLRWSSWPPCLSWS